MIAEELKSTGSSLVPGEQLVYVTCKGNRGCTVYTVHSTATARGCPVSIYIKFAQIKGTVSREFCIN